MKVTVDHAKCQGHAMCFSYAPEIFELDEFGYNRMQPFEVPPGEEGQAERAAAMCPERAISIDR